MKNSMKRVSLVKKIIIFSFLYFIIISCSNYMENDTPNAFKTDYEYYNNALEEDYASDQIIVKVDSKVQPDDIDKLVNGVRIKTITSIDECIYVLYRINDMEKVEQTMGTLMASGKVVFAEKNAIYRTCDVLNDPYYEDYQYAPGITDCEAGWNITTGEENDIIVAVIDTGINGEHEDIAGHVIAGRNILTDTDIPASANSDTIGHGTHVAGIIGAMGNNGKGIAGVAWNARLMPVKVFELDTNTYSADIAEGVVWAIDNGADILNLSLSGGVFSMLLNDTVNYAHQNNVTFIAAMGNDRKSMIKYPAALPGVIAIGSSNGRDKVSFYSTQGEHISVVAPGESIYSLDYSQTDTYMYASGTSMATPFVAGLAALLLSRDTSLSPGHIRSMIEDSAEPLGIDSFSCEYGHGRVNVHNALTIEKHNNYGSIEVNVTNKGYPIGGIKVLLEDETGKIVQSGITSFGGMQGGVNGQIVFHHVRAGKYNMRVRIGESRKQDVTLAQEEKISTNIEFESYAVLLVNAIKNVDLLLLTDELLYVEKLESMGKYFTTWKILYFGSPTIELVSAYDMVVWFTGTTKSNPEENIEVLSEQEINVLKTYMDEGGKLYLCGNNMAEHLDSFDPYFLENYLHAKFVQPAIENEYLIGRDFLDGMEMDLYMKDDDQIGLVEGAIGILDSNEESIADDWAGLYWNEDNGYKLVFTTMCPNEILYSSPDNFFESIIEWLELE